LRALSGIAFIYSSRAHRNRVLPLHGGRAPSWLFARMVLLSREVLGHVVAE